MYSKIKRILAMSGVIFLVALYVISFFLGISKNPNAFPMFIASMFATLFIVTMLYVYQLVYKITRKDDKNKDDFPYKDQS